jgi:hypothetical protein
MGEIREERRIDARAMFGGSVVSLKAITSFLWHEARLVVRSPASGAATMPIYRAPETFEPYRQPTSRDCHVTAAEFARYAVSAQVT